MSVEPQNEQLAPRLRRIAGDAADRPHRQAVIAAEYDRRPSGARDCIGFAGQQPRPGRDLGEPMRLAFRRGRRGATDGEARDRLGPRRRDRGPSASPRSLPCAAWPVPSPRPATLAPASIGAPRRVIGRGSGKVALPPSSAIDFGLTTSPFARSNAKRFWGRLLRQTKRKFRDAKRNEMASHRNRLGAKSRDFAELCVFKGLTGFSFRRFRQRARRPARRASARDFRAPGHHSR